jgi:penicillin amidase
MKSKDPRVEQARVELIKWDRHLSADSPAAALYVAFERALWRQISEARVPATMLDDYLGRTDFRLADAMKADPLLLLNALSIAAQQSKPRISEVTFRHPLAITQASRRLFNVGPFAPGGYADTVQSFSTRSSVDVGPSFREIIDVSAWDRSVATNAPGQSAWPRSAHFADLAKLWAAGEYFPLSFSDRAIQANAESTLTLRPR